MLLYLMRHGPAGSRQDWSGEDAERPLTAQGANQVAAVSDALAALDIVPDVVIASPYARAEQTAAIVSERLGSAAPDLDERLAPGFGPADLELLLTDHSDSERIMLVGHEPDFSATLAHLTGARAHFKKSAVACVELEVTRADRGTLQWLVPPKILVPAPR